MPAVNKFKEFRTVWQRSFFVTLFFVTIAALLFWLDTFHAYQSEVRVLIIGKSNTVSIDQVVENFSELSTNLSFYERVLENNDLIDDDFEGYSKDERKARWNEIVSVKRSDKSGVLSVIATQDTPEKAKRLSEETVKTLFAVASLYYNIKTDIDLRVVDEPIGKTVLAHPVQYVLTSVGSALAATTAFFVLLSIIPGMLGKRTVRTIPEYPIGASVPFLDPQKFIPARPTTLSFESSHHVRSFKNEAPVATPLNGSERMLPGMDATELPFQFEESYPEEDSFTDLPVTAGFVDDDVKLKESATQVEEVKKGEPTVEEYKRRLNELLSGGK